MQITTIKTLLMKRAKYSTFEELKSYLREIDVPYDDKALKRDLIKLIEANTCEESQLFTLSRYTRMTSNEIKDLLKISDYMLHQMIDNGLLQICHTRWLNYKKIHLYSAENVLVMAKYGVPLRYRTGAQKPYRSKHPGIEGIYVDPVELSDIKEVHIQEVLRSIEQHKIAYIRTRTTFLIPLTQFKNIYFEEVLK